MSRPSHITILGGGAAGLALGYYAKKKRIPFTIYEASNQIGGNCVTLEWGDFLFDSGAHRYHDKDAETTQEIKELVGEDFRRVRVCSQIYHDGRFIDFPLSPLNLMKNLGLYTFGKAAVEVVRSKLRAKQVPRSFETFASDTYGNTVAERFLLNYCEKLWGLSCERLSPGIAGRRMKGLDLRTFLVEAVFSQRAKVEHLDGSFYYPKMGIGTITRKLGEFCGEENILRNSRISKILYNSTRIQAVEVNGKKRIDTDEVVSTLPLSVFLEMMEPAPPGGILHLAKSLRYRDVILVAFFLDRESVTKAATVYFPERDLLFTRVYEPKNRGPYMSPAGKTSLVAEIPCRRGDNLWYSGDGKLIELVRSQLIRIGWINEDEVIGGLVRRLNYAYPVLEIGFEKKVREITAFLKGISNLKLSGRNGRFIYAWVHNMMRFGKEIIEEYGLECKKDAGRIKIEEAARKNDGHRKGHIKQELSL